MNLSKLFETQKILDNRIVDEHKLHGRDLLPMKILALLTELGELANEWRGFKFWSKDQESRTKQVLGWVNPCEYRNPLLEEYVDGLHFILSIGNELKIYPKIKESMINKSITDCFLDLFEYASKLDNFDDYDYDFMFNQFIELGEMLGFSWSEIEQSYYAKNAINHDRQSAGY